MAATLEAQASALRVLVKLRPEELVRAHIVARRVEAELLRDRVLSACETLEAILADESLRKRVERSLP